jgi:hypothetical protein
VVFLTYISKWTFVSGVVTPESFRANFVQCIRAKMTPPQTPPQGTKRNADGDELQHVKATLETYSSNACDLKNVTDDYVDLFYDIRLHKRESGDDARLATAFSECMISYLYGGDSKAVAEQTDLLRLHLNKLLGEASPTPASPEGA